MLKQIFNYSKLRDIVSKFVAYASTLDGLTGIDKKNKVIDMVIDFQQKNYNIKWLPDSLEILILRYLLDTLVEEVYSVFKSEEI